MSSLPNGEAPVCEIRVQGSSPAIHRVVDFPCRIGRSAECDVVIDEPSVSGLHAVLVLLPDNRLQIEDQWSTNGIHVDRKRVKQLAIDRPTDLVFGRVAVSMSPSGGAHGEELPPGISDTVAFDVDDESGGYLYRRDGVEHGPYPWDRLRELAQEDTIKGSDLIWGPDATAWMRAEFISGLFSGEPVAKCRSEEPTEEEPTVVVRPKAQADAVAPEPVEEDAPTEIRVSPKAEAPSAPEPAPEVSVPRPGRVQEISVEKPSAKAGEGAQSGTGTGKAKGKGRASKADELAKPPSNRRGIVCPHCWHRFAVEEFLFIARHQSLVGDPVLGADAQQRFLPSRFTPEGHAVDSAGMSCPDMACPRCHLRIPQTASEMPPLFLSIVGATASGKSYFLTSMSWELRNTLNRNFAISFTDTDAINNQILNDFEDTVFLNSDSDRLVALEKTELQGELYNQVLLDGMLINLPKPFMFSVTPSEHHPEYEAVRERTSRTLVLYDNAGEHFEPGMDSVDNPTTQHLLHSDTIFFLFDPTKDVRFRRLVNSDDPQMTRGARVQRQGIILTEMINRIKKYSGMRAGVKSRKTLMVVVSKCDVWLDMLALDLPREPWQWDPKLHTCALDVDAIKNVSFALRSLLERVCPEVVSTAESFAGDVYYLPNSALGHHPELNEETGMIGIRPRDVDPIWADVPMLYFFCERGFIPALSRGRREERETVPIEYKVSGDVVFVTLPGQEKPLQVPLSYLGARLQCPCTGVWFDMPNPRKAWLRHREKQV